MASAWQGRVVDGRYTLEALLGEGGMGVVYRARHVLTGAAVALKSMHARIAAMPDVAARFLVEARAPAAIGHPGIVKVTDAGKTADGELYLVMELLEGETLRARLEKGLPPRPVTFAWALAVLDALGAAHAAGIVHRDLKPENVFLTEAGSAKLVDFGIAKVAAPGAAATATGSVMGTAAYMSPEQLRDTSKVDRRADLWALAVILFEALSGRRPFAGQSGPEEVANILSKPAPPLSAVTQQPSPELDAFFARAFASDVNARFGTAAETAAELAALADREARALGPTTLASSTPSESLASAVALPSEPGVTSSTMRSEYNPLLEVRLPHPPPAPPPAKRRIPTAAWVAVGIVGLAAASGAIALGLFAVEREPAPVTNAPTTRRTAAPRAHPPAETEDALCERACDELEKCTGVSGSNCRADCGRNAEYRTCVRPLRHADCRGAAMCALASGCSGKLPAGRSTCKQAAECEFACAQHKGAVACTCGCVEKTSPEKAVELAANNLCAITNCGGECKAPANPLVCGACMTQHCRASNQACLAR